MSDHYESGPEGMPRVKRMTDSTLDWVIRDSLFNVLDSYHGEDRDRLHALMHDTAEEVLARVPAWPTQPPTEHVERRNAILAHQTAPTAGSVPQATPEEIEMARLAAEHFGRPVADIPALVAFERHRAEQVKIVGMPGLSGAIPNFVAGFHAGRAAPQGQAERAAVPEGLARLPRYAEVHKGNSKFELEHVAAGYPNALVYVDDVQRMLAAAPVAQEGKAVDGWKVLAEDDKPDAARLLDVVLTNGVTFERAPYGKIDWTQVRDWRYSPAQQTSSQVDAPEGGEHA